MGLVNDKSINKYTNYSCDAAPAIKKFNKSLLKNLIAINRLKR